MLYALNPPLRAYHEQQAIRLAAELFEKCRRENAVQLQIEIDHWSELRKCLAGMGREGDTQTPG